MVISTAILTTYLRRSPEDVHSFVEEGRLGADGEVISNSQVIATGYRSQQVRYEHVYPWTRISCTCSKISQYSTH